MDRTAPVFFKKVGEPHVLGCEPGERATTDVLGVVRAVGDRLEAHVCSETHVLLSLDISTVRQRAAVADVLLKTMAKSTFDYDETSSVPSESPLAQLDPEIATVLRDARPASVTQRLPVALTWHGW